MLSLTFQSLSLFILKVLLAFWHPAHGRGKCVQFLFSDSIYLRTGECLYETALPLQNQGNIGGAKRIWNRTHGQQTEFYGLWQYRFFSGNVLVGFSEDCEIFSTLLSFFEDLGGKVGFSFAEVPTGKTWVGKFDAIKYTSGLLIS